MGCPQQGALGANSLLLAYDHGAVTEMRNVKRSTTVLILALVAVAGPGCAGGESGDGPSDAGGSRVIDFDPGSEPRRMLRAAPATPRTWRVLASNVQTTRLDGAEETERAEASSLLSVSFSNDRQGPVVKFWPRVERFDTTFDTRLGDGQPGATVQRFDDRGLLLRESRFPRRVSREVLDAATLDVFSLPRTYLNAPEESVGEGARWVLEIDEGAYVLHVEERITAMDDDELQVERTVTLAESRGRVESVEATATAVYETATLFLREAQIDTRFTFSMTLPVDGEVATLTATVESSRTIGEVAP